MIDLEYLNLYTARYPTLQWYRNGEQFDNWWLFSLHMEGIDLIGGVSRDLGFQVKDDSGQILTEIEWND